MGRKTKSQSERILRYLQKGNKLTPLKALNMFGCFRLSGRVFDIKARGFEVGTKMVKRGKKFVAEYSLV